MSIVLRKKLENLSSFYEDKEINACLVSTIFEDRYEVIRLVREEGHSQLSTMCAVMLDHLEAQIMDRQNKAHLKTYNFYEELSKRAYTLVNRNSKC